MIKPIHIEARDLNDCWFQTIEAIVTHGRKWKVDHGSYVGVNRYELDYFTAHIKFPGTRPLIPDIPAELGIPNPVEQDYVDQYMPYLLTTHKEDEEFYTYGERLVPQMEKIIERFSNNGFGSNQECISISKPEDIDLPDPPCLRSIDCRIFKDECRKENEPIALHFYLYFRSWDGYSGLPANLAGLRLVQEYMASEISNLSGKEVEAGEIIAASKGIHIYEHAIDLAKLRTAF